MADKVMVFETDLEIERQIAGLLFDAGYEISPHCAGGMQAIQAFQPDVVILGAVPPKLDCCDLLSEIKNSDQTKSIRVILVAPGGSGERSPGLDLGASNRWNSWLACALSSGTSSLKTNSVIGYGLPSRVARTPTKWSRQLIRTAARYGLASVH
jgi:CheY-like chemotaxis protein